MSGYWIGWEAGSWGQSWGYDAGGEPIPVEESLQPAGHWKHLFKPVQNVAITATRVVGKATVRFIKPSTTVGIAHAQVFLTGTRGRSRISAVSVKHGSSVTIRSSRSTSKVRARAKASAGVTFLPTGAKGLVFGHASASAVLTCRSVRGSVFVNGAHVRTTQNPDEAMLLAVFS